MEAREWHQQKRCKQATTPPGALHPAAAAGAAHRNSARRIQRAAAPALQRHRSAHQQAARQPRSSAQRLRCGAGGGQGCKLCQRAQHAQQRVPRAGQPRRWQAVQVLRRGRVVYQGTVSPRTKCGPEEGLPMRGSPANLAHTWIVSSASFIASCTRCSASATCGSMPSCGSPTGVRTSMGGCSSAAPPAAAAGTGGTCCWRAVRRRCGWARLLGVAGRAQPCGRRSGCCTEQRGRGRRRGKRAGNG